jgi:protoporphyrinogen oxidase
MSSNQISKEIVIIGAGPAGLTAAYELEKLGTKPVVLEADNQVGGISKTVLVDGWRFDIGGHRFFTKVPRVEQFWHEILGQEDFLLRPRISRIYYKEKFYDYPLRAFNALGNLGILEASRCLVSYALARLFPPRDQSNFEGWVASKFGWRLYRIFFKTYTEKVWGIPATSIRADWAAQRIKNLSLGKAVINSFSKKGKNSTEFTSLIEQFQYPKYGPGMMWEKCAEILEGRGVSIHLNSTVKKISKSHDQRLVIETNLSTSFECDYIISSMPINDVILCLDPSPPQEIVFASSKIRHRDFLTVALIVPEDKAFPDNWIYIHSDQVKVGRIQNFGSWSPFMVKEGWTCLGLEYFVNEGDQHWTLSDTELIELATQELETLKLVPRACVQNGYVVRQSKAYPIYDEHYADALETIRRYLELNWPNILPVGRNGMHRYNNQDHSMYTAMLTTENIIDNKNHDVWSVNVDDDYHEIKSGNI